MTIARALDDYNEDLQKTLKIKYNLVLKIEKGEFNLYKLPERSKQQERKKGPSLGM